MGAHLIGYRPNENGLGQPITPHTVGGWRRRTRGRIGAAAVGQHLPAFGRPHLEPHRSVATDRDGPETHIVGTLKITGSHRMVANRVIRPFSEHPRS